MHDYRTQDHPISTHSTSATTPSSSPNTAQNQDIVFTLDFNQKQPIVRIQERQGVKWYTSLQEKSYIEREISEKIKEMYRRIRAKRRKELSYRGVKGRGLDSSTLIRLQGLKLELQFRLEQQHLQLELQLELELELG